MIAWRESRRVVSSSCSGSCVSMLIPLKGKREEGDVRDLLAASMNPA